jgi:hypothetical protein
MHFGAFQYQRVPQNGSTHKNPNQSFSTVCATMLLVI